MFVPNISQWFEIILTLHCNKKCQNCGQYCEKNWMKMEIYVYMEKLAIWNTDTFKLEQLDNKSLFQSVIRISPGWQEPAGWPASASEYSEEDRDLHLDTWHLDTWHLDTWHLDTSHSPPARRVLLQAIFCNPGFQKWKSQCTSDSWIYPGVCWHPLSHHL